MSLQKCPLWKGDALEMEYVKEGPLLRAESTMVLSWVEGAPSGRAVLLIVLQLVSSLLLHS